MIVAVMFSVASGACGNATGGDVTSAVDGGARVDGGMNDGGPADGGTPFVACLPAPVLPPDLGCALPDALDDALTEAGLTRDTLRFSARDWALFPNSLAHDAFRLPFFDAIHDEPLRAPGWGRALVDELDAAAESTRPASALLQVVAQRMGHALDACALPPTSDKNGFFDAIVALHEGAPLDDEAALIEAVTRVPEALRRALTPILRASHDAARARDEAFAALTEAQRQLFFDTAIGLFLPSPIGAPRLSQTAVRDALQSGIRMDVLYAAAARLTATIEAADLRPFAGLRGFEFTARTPRGRIVLRDGADHEHSPDDPALAGELLLFVDTGGNDVYRVQAGANASLANPVSVLIDLAGDDTYAYVEAPDPGDGARLPSDEAGRYVSSLDVTRDNGPVSLSIAARQGGALMGIALHFDYGGGRDHYRSLRMSQGAGVLGVGVLFDDGGDDDYAVEAGAQGAGAYGIGLLVDQGGNDVYRGYHAVQGYGWVRGAGLLYDRAGDDRYLADLGDPARGGDPLYFTPQLPGRGNASFAQGVGFGRRADVASGGDGVYQSGGLGVLRDRRGNDTYRASVFGQGAGYWFGTGVLADGQGDDGYDGLWYVQGSAAHFALALFLEGGGNDRYNQLVEPAATSIGVGHDMSVAWHIDLGGDDLYRAPGLSLGSGNVNGMGFLINVGGNDLYTSSEPTLGAASLSSEANQPGNARRERNTVGVFVDVGGADLYTVSGMRLSRDNTHWRNNRDPDPTVTTEHGAGLDAATGVVCFPAWPQH